MEIGEVDIGVAILKKRSFEKNAFKVFSYLQFQ
jgi:hypothetical protein